ncbi:hypothetical protein DVR12_17745 [Chitinophaga silvatica]|uniref:Uncharacterized protein n=2 Tax=Chitinophaga silvatica TaxID=2282649 RepID=A0A3E1Y7X0_9BACT|nr:hypothetical protein DVR12_17745 [Chitinophaga silvatica]
MFRDNVSDTLIINNQKFDLNKIVKNQIVAIVHKLFTFKQGNDDYLCLKILDASNGRVLTCYLIVFNITNRNHVICLNEKANISGATWKVKENLITDQDNDGLLELNLSDSLNIRSYLISPTTLIKTDKCLVLEQVDDLRFCVDLKRSNWYFNIGNYLSKCGRCRFDFNEVIPESSY